MGWLKGWKTNPRADSDNCVKFHFNEGIQFDNRADFPSRLLSLLIQLLNHPLSIKKDIHTLVDSLGP